MTVLPAKSAAVSRAAVLAVPEPGQVVEVRGSTWAVAQVRPQGLPRSPADEAAVTSELAVALGARTVSFLIADLSVRALVRLAHVPSSGTGGARRYRDEAAP